MPSPAAPVGVQAELGLAPPEAKPEAGCLTHWLTGLDAVTGDWRPLIDGFLASPAGQKVGAFVRARLAAGAVVYPLQPFRAFTLTPRDAVRVVILGQDPYHGPGQAEGLAFSVAPGIRIPPSLRNIFKELQRDLGLKPPANGSLVRWAEQGVLLLNASLTVEAGAAGSHARQGWEALTDAVVESVARQSGPVVFLLWGAHAQAKRELIARADPDGRHRVLMANHPSPLSALRPPQPFLGCGHFRAANEFLSLNQETPVNW
jgi:uracil-DNA glycosylase